MELTQSSTLKTIAILLVLTAITQPIYTALYLGAPDVNRLFLWGLEGILFALLAAFAGSALAMTKRHTLAFSAIAFAAILNVVQVGIGYTQFGPFSQAAETNPDLGAVAFAIVSLAFFLYNAAKVLLGLAAIVFGMAKLKEGSKALGGLTVLVGGIAFVANAVLVMTGLNGFLPSPVAGGSGVAATLLIALCLFTMSKED